ncbi:MAG: methyltransferase domain-containing protein [Epsilonproteobacteria bacterium]|nr:methyltransferase domain-containing protein [Campylobacterota bacterium]
MLEDKIRWNKKFLSQPMPQEPARVVKEYISHAKVGDALDIACGTGRHTHFLAELGFLVDAVDFSDYALSKIKNMATINRIESDLDRYNIPANRYDLIINTNYLNRRLLPMIVDGLKSGGVVIFETFIVAHGDFENPQMNVDYLLRENELLRTFSGLHVIFYEERLDTNLRGERVKIASIVAQKR